MDMGHSLLFCVNDQQQKQMGSNGFRIKQDGDLQSQARKRLSKDELRTDIVSGDGRWQMADGR